VEVKMSHSLNPLSDLGAPNPSQKFSLGVRLWQLQDCFLKSARKRSYKAAQKKNHDWMLNTHNIDEKAF
jgi:hypothetical protein